MTLVFVHGAGCTGGVFNSQVAAFPNSVALTLPGHTTPGTPSTIDEFADAVAGELEKRDLSGVVLCGHSMGSAIALELALRKSERVAALALLGGGARLRVAPAIFDSIASDFPGAARTLAQAFFANPTPDLVDPAIAGLLEVGAEQTLRDFRACDVFDVTERLVELRLPVLTLTGERDVMTPPKYAHFIADRVPGAVPRILPDAGHLCMIERPADTNEALHSFVTRIEK